MRVAHLARSSLPGVGGAQVMLHNLAVEQARRGHEVTVIARWPIARLARRGLPYRVAPLAPATFHRASRGDLEPRGHWLIRRQLEHHQRAGRFDVWHLHTAHPVGWAALGPLRALGIPTVLTSHGADVMAAPDIDYGDRRFSWVDERVRRTLPEHEAVVAISGTIHGLFIELGVPPEHIHDVPNGVDVERIAAHEVDRGAVRRRYGLPDDAELVLTTARYDRAVKGLDLVPAAAAHLARSRPSARWVVIGHGTRALEPELARHGVTDVVKVGDVRPERISADTLPGNHLLDLYRAADVFVLPSRVEGSPLAAVEAMAAGLPVIAADVPGCRELVDDGSTGCLCPVGDAIALGDAAVRLLADSGERAVLAARAQRRAMRFSLTAMAEAYDSVYAGVIPVGST